MPTTTRPPSATTLPTISDEDETQPMTQTRPTANTPAMGNTNPQALARGAVILIVLFVIGALILGNTGSGSSVSLGTDNEASQPSATTPAVTDNATGTPSDNTTATTIALRAPGAIRILAANGTSTKGVGKRAQNVLANSGYNVLVAVDAKSTPTSAVYYATGYEREAVVVQTLFGFLPESVLPMPAAVPLKQPTDLMDASILVVVGTDGVAKIPA